MLFNDVDEIDEISALNFGQISLTIPVLSGMMICEGLSGLSGRKTDSL